MKSVKTTSRRMAYAALMSVAVFATSCNNDKPEDPKDVAEEINDENIDDRKSEKDAQFLVNAAEINFAEIKLGQLAQQKGTLKDVKDMGAMMVKEHETALTDLKKLAASKSIVLPAAITEDNQKDYDKLNEKTGKDFDKEYADMMVKGHKDAIDKFEKASSDAEDADIRNWASSMLPTLRSHLEHSEMIQEKAKAAK